MGSNVSAPLAPLRAALSAAQARADLGVSKADTAQTRADLGVSKADAAQTAANNAQSTANSKRTLAQVNASISSALTPYGERFTSSAITPVANGTITVAHGLGEIPGIVQFRAVCTEAQEGFAVGDELMFNPASNGSAAHTIAHNVQVDATNIQVKWANNSRLFYGGQASGSSQVPLSIGNWDVHVEAIV